MGVFSTFTGHVGPPLSCCHIKVVDVPEMNYFAKDDKGEICFRGPNVFVGYLNNEGKTKETIDEDGWVCEPCSDEKSMYLRELISKR